MYINTSTFQNRLNKLCCSNYFNLKIVGSSHEKILKILITLGHLLLYVYIYIYIYIIQASIVKNIIPKSFRHNQVQYKVK